MGGYTGRLHIGGPKEALLAIGPFLAIGEIGFIGADIAFGCGGFRLEEEASYSGLDQGHVRDIE